MKYIRELKDGSRMSGIYLCKKRQSATTRNGKTYDNIILQDRTGTMDGKIWDPNSDAIEEFEALDYVDISGEVSSYNGSLQVSVHRARKAREGEYNEADYLPVSRYRIDEMVKRLLFYVDSVQNPHLKALLTVFFGEDSEVMQSFRTGSAAKSLHHGFIGGLLEHTISVAGMCLYFTKFYSYLNHDLLITAALLHDIGKIRELSSFPENDYTDEGQLLGHIMIGAEMIHDAVRTLPDFPAQLENELKHCILAHHGEFEFGSPKKPALAEAMALNLADNADAKLEAMRELLEDAGDNKDWLGYNRLFESNIRKTGEF